MKHVLPFLAVLGTLGPNPAGAVSSPSSGSLARTVATARRWGKPVLVVIVPGGEEQRAAREDMLAALLVAGGDELHANLSMVELACASMVQVRECFPQTAAWNEPQFVLCETLSGRPTVTAISVPLPPPPPSLLPRWTDHGSDDPRRAWIEPLERRIDAALALDTEMLSARARMARSALGPHRTANATRQIKSGRKPLRRAGIDEAAAIYRHAAEVAPQTRAVWLPILASEGRRRLRDVSLDFPGRTIPGVGCTCPGPGGPKPEDAGNE